MSVVNFGRNVRFAPAKVYQPASETEVLAALAAHAGGKVRVAGALHSWSPVVATRGALLDLRRFDGVELERDSDGAVWATIGGGCHIKHALRRLRNEAGATLPSVGLITEQSLAGAVSTATHGSGKHSLSHYAAELRVAAFDPATGTPAVHTFAGGVDLQAARCALGCMGVILSAKVKCVPVHDVAEVVEPCATLDDVLAGEAKFPLQQFYLLPHAWTYFAQRRVAVAGPPRGSWTTGLYRAYWLLGIDVGLHVIIRTLADELRTRRGVRWFFRKPLPRLILTNATVADRSDRTLTMKHDLFRHREVEIHVPARHLRAAANLTRFLLEVLDGAAPAGDAADRLAAAGLTDELRRLRGTYTHHYPITFRKVLPDDTLLSPSAGGGEPWYAVSFISFAGPWDGFDAAAGLLGRAFFRLLGGRPHWGKLFPLNGADVAAAYPTLGEFRAVCRRVDPNGVFRNDFAERVLFAG